ncbi:MAG: putative membrane protein [Candidatus Methanohalarchaeum thermophilum]|uniref:Membrane protein n=1 Tax=Methanohalarchaeum thermophilum TaxID=1903181 RepID=A0A1Q6DXB1_METT1|nr:MAG: putative membrane protein [Candidatus Methanohalarchaeum thermophilum]
MTLDIFFQALGNLEVLVFRILPIVVLGIILGNIIYELGLIDKISVLSAPIIKFANLPKESGLTLVTMIASPAASYSMLSNFYEREILDEKQTVVTTFTNTFFAYFRHVFTFYLPVVIPILGLKTGLIYIFVRIIISLFSTLFGMAVGHFYLNLEDSSLEFEDIGENRSNGTIKQKIIEGFKKSKPTLRKIVPRLTLVYVLVAFALVLDLFEPIGRLADPITTLIGLPGEASTVIIARFANVTASFVLAGNLLNSGILGSYEVIATLLIGSLFSLFTHFLKTSLPNKIAYFGTNLGIKVALYNWVISTSFILIITFFLYFLM